MRSMRWPSAIGDRVERMVSLAGWIVRDDRNRAALEKKATQTIAVVGGVGGQASACRNCADQGCCDTNVAAMARRHFDGDRASARVDNGVDLVVRPPRERPITCASAPFSARRRAVGLGRRAVDGLTIAGIGARQRVKQPTPNAAHRPAAKAIVDRRRRPVDGRAILPPTARFQNVDDPADNPPVVGPSRSGLVLGQERPNGPPIALRSTKIHPP